MAPTQGLPGGCGSYALGFPEHSWLLEQRSNHSIQSLSRGTGSDFEKMSMIVTFASLCPYIDALWPSLRKKTVCPCGSSEASTMSEKNVNHILWSGQSPSYLNR